MKLGNLFQPSKEQVNNDSVSSSTEVQPQSQLNTKSSIAGGDGMASSQSSVNNLPPSDLKEKSPTPLPSATASANKVNSGSESEAGEILFQWKTSAYIEHERSIWWYVLLVLFMVAWVAFSIFILHEWLGAVVLLLLGVVVFLFARKKPGDLECSLSESGIAINGKLYPYIMFRSFSLVSDGGVTSLEFDPLKRFAPGLSVFISPEDEPKILEVLEPYLARGEREHSAVDRLARTLKI